MATAHARLGELLVDHDLLDRRRVTPPRRRPVRGDEAGVGDGGEVLLRVGARVGLDPVGARGRIQGSRHQMELAVADDGVGAQSGGEPGAQAMVPGAIFESGGDLGEQTVKNIAEPIRAYRVVIDAAGEKPARRTR